MAMPMPLSDLTNTNTTISLSLSSARPCSSIGSSLSLLPHIHDHVVESQDRRRGKGRGKASVAESGYSTKATAKFKQINREKEKPQKGSRHPRNLGLVARNVKKVPREFTPPLNYIEKQRAYFAEIDAFELDEEEVSERELD